MIDGGNNIKEVDWNFLTNINREIIIGSACCSRFYERAGRLEVYLKGEESLPSQIMWIKIESRFIISFYLNLKKKN